MAQSKAQELRKDPLYKELGEIGRQQYPLDPTNLAAREQLLACPAVTQAGYANAGEPNAAKAIRTAVASVKPETDQVIAKVIFGVGAFEGKSVTDRLKCLLKHYFISKDTYDKRRPFVLEKVMFYLRQPPQEEMPPGPDLEASGGGAPKIWFGDERTAVLTCLARAVATLQFSGLAYLFADERPIPPDFDTFGNPIGSRLEEDTFQSFTNFLAEPVTLATRLLKAPDALSPTDAFRYLLEHEELQPTIPDSDRIALITLFDGVISCSPFGMKQCEHIVRIGSSASPSILARDLPHEYITWLIWCVANAPEAPQTSRHRDSPQLIESVIAKCGQMERLLQRHVDYSAPVVSNARRRVHKLLALLYDTEEWAADSDRPSLRDRAEKDFARNMAMLATDDIVWYVCDGRKLDVFDGYDTESRVTE